MCFMKSKCNWCNEKKSDIIIIKIYCKWYNYNICEECYNYKLINKSNIKPISKPLFNRCVLV